jgi:hypothetical protein
MSKKHHPANGGQSNRAARTETLYEAELRRRHPLIAREVLEAWSEGR